MKKFLSILFFFAAIGAVNAQDNNPATEDAPATENHSWLHIYHNSHNFTTLKANTIQSITHSGLDTDNPVMQITCGDQTTTLPLNDVKHCEIATNIPTIRINLIDYPELTDPQDKETYLKATIQIDGNGAFDDLPPTEVSIKGRGNSTWTWKKKPYRLKFDKKTALLDFKKQKSYVLLANYIDCTLMRNAIAMKTAQLLGMPFTNHIQPVRVYFNDIYKGSYMITEKVGISGTSVDIDENTGILFELDQNYDEPYKFRSTIYNLPVMIKDPDLDEIAAAQGKTAEELFIEWQDNFLAFEKKVYRGTIVDKVDYDLESLVNYLIVHHLCGNREILWPKSTYMYKTDLDSPMHFGPVWDFDWAFTYNNGEETKDPERILLGKWSPLLGEPFFSKLCYQTVVKEAFAKKWKEFSEEKLDELFEYIDTYAATIRASAIENGTIWPSVSGLTTCTYDFDYNVEYLKEWLRIRINYISTAPNNGLY